MEIRSQRAMTEDSNAGLSCLSAPEFLAALERSGVLPDVKWREVQDRFVQRPGPDDSLALAHQLIKEGTLTEFQARRLLRGKRAWPSAAMLCSTTSAKARGAGCSKRGTA